MLASQSRFAATTARAEGLTIQDDASFEVVGELGRGGCAIVYDAIDRTATPTSTSRRVALKVLSGPDDATNGVAIARLAREARAALAINHPNVCRVLSCGLLDDGRPYVAMERLEGETLRTYMRRRGALSVEEAIEITVQILSGLEMAHSLGVVHRDMKPENVFISWERGNANEPFPRMKILDFGMCRRVAASGIPEHDAILDDRTLTACGSVVGTPGYFSPEQACGSRTTDPRTDLFAVGLLMFEMLTGRRAFRGKDIVQLVYSVIETNIPSVRFIREELPTSLDRIIACATERDPRARYVSASLFMHDLLQARTTIRREARGLAKTLNSARSRAATTITHDDWNVPTREITLDTRDLICVA